MKCTINSIRNIDLGNNRAGSRVEGFLPFTMGLIPDHIMRWILNYGGVKIVCYKNGLYIASWAETVCSDKDEYDPVKGLHIAESKSKAKIYRFLKHFFNKMSNYFEDLSDIFLDAFAKYDHCVEHEEDHIDFLDKGENE